MRKNIVRRFVVLLAFVILPFVGYMTAVNVTSSQAQVCGVDNCIGASGDAYGSLGDALIAIYTDILAPALDQTTALLSAYFGPLTVYWSRAFHPVQDWEQRYLADWWNAFWYYNLLPTMQDMGRELTSANVEQAFAVGMFSDAMNVIRSRRVQDDMDIEQQREQRPSENVCTSGSLMSGLERATSYSDNYEAASAYGKLWVAANAVNNASAAGYPTYMCQRWNGCVTGFGTIGYAPKWCNASFNNGFAGCMANGTQVGTDVDVAGLIFAQDTIPIDPVQDPAGLTKDNMDELVTNLAEAFVKDPVTAGPLTAGSPGRESILQSVSYKTKRQVVYDGLYYVISRRVPGGLRFDSPGMPAPLPAPAPNYVQLLQEIRAETGENLSTSTNPSRNEVLRALMTQRFRSGKYSLRQQDEPENNQRELVIEQALQLIQMSDQLDLMDHYSLLLASQISTEVLSDKYFVSAVEGAPLK